jgi:hypothetical protein
MRPAVIGLAAALVEQAIADRGAATLSSKGFPSVAFSSYDLKARRLSYPYGEPRQRQGAQPMCAHRPFLIFDPRAFQRWRRTHQRLFSTSDTAFTAEACACIFSSCARFIEISAMTGGSSNTCSLCIRAANPTDINRQFHHVGGRYVEA